MPRYVVIRESVEAPPQKERVAGQGGNLELDYQLPVKHVIMAAFFAFWKSKPFWLVLTIVLGILVSVPPDLRLRLWPLVLVTIPFGIVPAFNAADKEWTIFTGLVKQSRWAQEVATGRDLDGDGHIGKPPIVINGAPQRPTREQIARQQKEEFRAWILSLDTAGTAFRAHESLGRDEYNRRREKLMAAGWAEWRNPAVTTLGWILTAPAADVAASIE